MGMRLDDPRFEPEGDLTVEDELEFEEDVDVSDESDKGNEPEPLESDAGEDIPDEYFGYRLADIEDPEAKKATYEALQEANRVANRRLQEIAELRKQAEEEARKTLPTQQAPESDEPAELSDEELLIQAGMDPELLQYDDFGKPLVALLRRQAELEKALEGQAQASEAEKWERQFYGKLEALEAENGAIPYDRETVEAFALERNVFDPEALYWTIMGPVLREAAKSPNPQPKRDLKRQVGGQPRRRASAPGATQLKTPKTLKEAFEVAKQQHNVPTGYDPFAFEE